jgi:TPR repeat protein
MTISPRLNVDARAAFGGFLLAALALSCVGASAGDSRSPATAIQPCPRDSTAFERVRSLADKKQAEAQATMADCYEQGRNVNPDGKKAIFWLTLSAQQGFVPAEYELGRTYLYGRGIPADYAQAILWEEKAAEAGHLNAQRDMALIYERGFGVSADPLRAAFWNRKAALQGDAQSQLHLANALDSGSGVPRDSHEAMEWYLKAAKQGLPEAELRVAEIYEQNPKDCASAFTWYVKAAHSGLTEAMYRMGKIHLEGTCGRVRVESALKWFQIGARNGSKECTMAANKLSATLTSDQKARAEQAADLWIKQNSTALEREEEDEQENR